MNMSEKINKEKGNLCDSLNILTDRAISTNHTYTIDIKLKNVSQLQREVLHTLLDYLECNEVIVAKYRIVND